MAVALNMLSSCVCVTCNFDKICFFAPADDSSNKIFILEATHITPDSTASNDYVPVRNHKVHGEDTDVSAERRTTGIHEDRFGMAERIDRPRHVFGTEYGNPEERSTRGQLSTHRCEWRHTPCHPMRRCLL